MSTLITQEVTIPAAGQVLVTFTSPRTGKQTFAKEVTVQALVSDATVSTDHGKNNMNVSHSNTAPTRLKGMIPDLWIVGTVAAKVEVSAVIAS